MFLKSEVSSIGTASSSTDESSSELLLESSVSNCAGLPELPSSDKGAIGSFILRVCFLRSLLYKYAPLKLKLLNTDD